MTVRIIIVNDSRHMSPIFTTISTLICVGATPIASWSKIKDIHPTFLILTSDFSVYLRVIHVALSKRITISCDLVRLPMRLKAALHGLLLSRIELSEIISYEVLVLLLGIKLFTSHLSIKLPVHDINPRYNLRLLNVL